MIITAFQLLRPEDHREPVCQTLSKALDISRATALVPPEPLKAQIILSDKLSEDLPLNEKTRNHTEIRKRSHFTMWSSSQLSAIFSEFLNHRNRTNGAVVFCCRPLPNILKYSDHMRDLPITWISRFLRVQLIYMRILA